MAFALPGRRSATSKADHRPLASSDSRGGRNRPANREAGPPGAGSRGRGASRETGCGSARAGPATGPQEGRATSQGEAAWALTSVGQIPPASAIASNEAPPRWRYEFLGRDPDGSHGVVPTGQGIRSVRHDRGHRLAQTSEERRVGRGLHGEFHGFAGHHPDPELGIVVVFPQKRGGRTGSLGQQMCGFFIGWSRGKYPARGAPARGDGNSARDLRLAEDRTREGLDFSQGVRGGVMIEFA